MAQPTQQQQILNEIRQISSIVAVVPETLRDFGQHMQDQDAKIEKLTKMLLGNGDPGIPERLRVLDARVERVEAKETTCPIADLALDINDINVRHASEDKAAAAVEEKEEKRDDHMAKFRYTLIASFILMAVDIALRLLKIY